MVHRSCEDISFPSLLSRCLTLGGLATTGSLDGPTNSLTYQRTFRNKNRKDICLHPYPPAFLFTEAQPSATTLSMPQTSSYSVSDVPASSISILANSLSVTSLDSPSSISITLVNRFSTNFNRLPTTSWLSSNVACSPPIAACSS